MEDYDLNEIINEIIDEENERSLIILGSSLIDDLLGLILRNFFISVDNKDESLLKGDNPLATFSARIKILYRLGIIDVEFMKILDTVRSIRNKCAHVAFININKGSISDLIKNIEKFFKEKESYKMVKTRYFTEDSIPNEILKNIFITMLLLLQSIYIKTEKSTLNTELANICRK